MRAERVCELEGCGEKHRAKGLCRAHYYRQYKRGTTELAERKPTYYSVHFKLGYQKGPAREHECVDCGRRADEWSYNHADPDELRELQRNGRWYVYSADLECYEPRCVPCHRTLDAAA